MPNYSDHPICGGTSRLFQVHPVERNWVNHDI